jgi:hypothetical protein
MFKSVCSSSSDTIALRSLVYLYTIRKTKKAERKKGINRGKNKNAEIYEKLKIDDVIEDFATMYI